MLSKAPVALRWTRISFERASRVRGIRAPDLAILVLLSSAYQISGRSISRDPVRTMSCKIGDTTNCVTLHFDIRAQHLTDKRFQAAKLDDEKLVVG